jgi:hypothetical protein
MPYRPPKKKKRMDKKVTQFPKQPAFQDLSKMVPTPDNIRVDNPELRKKMLSNHIAEIANHNTQLQDQIMAMQMRIASNNLVIEAIQNMAKSEGVQMSFNFEAPPADAVPDEADETPVVEEINENTPDPEVPPTQ